MTDSARLRRRFLMQLGPGLHLDQLFDFLPGVYLYVKDRQGRFMRVNVAQAALHGRTPEQMVGLTDFDVNPPHLANQYRDEDRQVMRSRVPLPNQVWLVGDHRGQLRWYVSSKLPLFSAKGQVIGLAGAMRDLEKAEFVVRPYRELEQVLTHVLAHYAERIDVADLARLAHLSVSQFDRKFKRLFQMTPQEYILRVRVNAACQTLASSRKSMSEIAQETGFCDQSYFTKQFRKHMGVTPLHYRQDAVLDGVESAGAIKT